MTKYFDKLESLRGLAAFAVVLYHSPFYLTGNPNNFVYNSYLFVDLFFILSGFVMANSYQEKIADGLRFRDYFFLRLGRIYPLYLTILGAWAIFIFAKWLLYLNQIEIVNPINVNGYDSFFAHLLMIQSLNLFNIGSWNYPAWSVSLEFFIYFVFFAFAKIFVKKYSIPIALILCFFSYLYLYQLGEGKLLNFTLIHGIYRCSGGFFAGVFLFHITKRVRNLGLKTTAILEIISVSLIIFFLANLEQNSRLIFLIIPIFIFAIYTFSLAKDGIIGKLLKLKPFANAGKYSYSVYLIHAIILDLIFSLTKYFILKPTEEIFYFQTEWTYLINSLLILLIYFVSKLTYFKIEKKWIEKSKKLVAEFHKLDEKQKEGSIFV